MFNVTELNSLSELSGLQTVWGDLLAATPGATFFQSLPWLQTYWQFYGDGVSALSHAANENTAPVRPERLRVLVVEANRELVGILPLVMTTEPYRVGPVRVLGYPLAGWGSFYGPIGPHPAATLQAGLQHIRRTDRDWDLLDLRWVDAEIDSNNTPQAMQAAGFGFDRQVWHQSAQVDLTPGWENYWGTRKSTWRSNVRRCERLLLKRGKLEYFRYRPLGEAHADGDPRWDLYDTCVQLAERSWQGDSSTGTTLSHDSVRSYLRAAHESAARAGAVDMNLLLLRDKPVAFSYNYHYRGWVYGVRNGYDPMAVQEGAGTVLLGKMIEDSCLCGDRLIDLGPNYLECKRYWLTRLQPAYHYTHFHPARLRAQALRLKRIVKRWLAWSRPEPQSAADQKSVNLLG
ncbi:MAG TPA: GNAT family N-acetyltransferase [Pirellulales bacterium]|jgi:CelD/BcsL family acetyltransferase involved in cellulose biosynthesis|nr:GNAT family N-acetyltransferase [Pirellulales bacterium]